jgi:DNA-directed RNA polymerase specialized sigma24 family protein
LFFEAVVAQRSVLLDDETALEGGATISLETQTDMAESDVLTYIEEHFGEFLKNLRYLSKEDQELLLSYYVLAKTQATLAILHRSTQTLCSARIRKAMQKMGTFIMLGPPTAAALRVVLLEHDLENLLEKPLSEVVELYARTRSFQRVAEVLRLHRPEIRRVMSQASKVLSESKDTRSRALGAYIFDLIDKASASGQGFSKRKMAKQGNLYCVDSPLLGEFRINVVDPGFQSVFVSRANR